MVINKTSAVETKIHAVSPVSNVGSSSAGAGASTGAATASTAGAATSVVSTTVTCSDGVGAVAASSAQATEPPKSAPDKLSANNIFFIRIPQPNLCELCVTQQTSCQIKRHRHLFHLYGYG
ncbi:hypothetical protein D3C71_1458960 [compost metagenome]